jgi:HK97 family phage prohead protease
VFLPGAFSNINTDVRLLLNHEPDVAFGSTKDRRHQLQLFDEPSGLFFELSSSGSAAGRLAQLAQRGTFSGVSIGFNTAACVTELEWVASDRMLHVVRDGSAALTEISLLWSEQPKYERTWVAAAHVTGAFDRSKANEHEPETQERRPL